MASYDAGVLTNKSKRSSRVYSDLNLDFLQNTATKDIQKIEDVDAVKRSVRNLINTMLFELYSPQMNHAISKEIDLLIKNYEPRARLVNVKTTSDAERNGYEVSISFYVVNFPEPVAVEAFLERLR